MPHDAQRRESSVDRSYEGEGLVVDLSWNDSAPARLSLAPNSTGRLTLDDLTITLDWSDELRVTFPDETKRVAPLGETTLQFEHRTLRLSSRKALLSSR